VFYTCNNEKYSNSVWVSRIFKPWDLAKFTLLPSKKQDFTSVRQ